MGVFYALCFVQEVIKGVIKKYNNVSFILKRVKIRLKKGYGCLKGLVYLCVTNRRKPKIL
jgi:hypothetical protein